MKEKVYLIDPSFYIHSFSTKKNNPPIKKISDFERSLTKAVSGNYEYLLLPENYLDSDNSFYFNKTIEKNLKVIFAIKATSFSHYKNTLLSLDKKRFFINIIFENIKNIPFSDLEPFSSQTLFTLFLTQKNRHINLKENLPSYALNNLEIYSPYKTALLDSFLTPHQVYKFIKNYNILNKKQIQPFFAEIYDKRIPLDMDLEPLTKPFAENNIESKKEIHFSIILPSYNNKTELIHSLNYLTKQDYPKNQFEIIVVDDGSTDNTLKDLNCFLNKNKDLNLKIIHFPRVIPRKSGDGRFRAGIARNLGSKYAKGEILAFLDADILTPPSYLKQLEQEHKTADIILLKRYHLKSNVDIQSFRQNFNQPKWKSSIYIEDEKYWGSFYQQGFQKTSVPWKYICTYGLSLTKKDFITVGRFSKNFLYYGFEDTDLGYRLYKSNKKFLLSQIKVYHQPISLKRHEHRKNIFTRYGLLSKTAKIFFYRHLDPRIYEELKVFMRQERGLSYFFPFLKSKTHS